MHFSIGKDKKELNMFYCVLLHSTYYVSSIQAHGLEILCAKHGGSGPTSNGVEVPSDRFAQFLKSLKDKGYFRVRYRMLQ